MSDYPTSREYEELERWGADEAANRCEWCGAPFDDHGYEQQARYCYPAQIEVFKRRLRELITLMEGDIAFKSIEAGATRKLILADARKLVPDMPPAKTLDEILCGAHVETKTDAS